MSLNLERSPDATDNIAVSDDLSASSDSLPAASREFDDLSARQLSASSDAAHVSSDNIAVSSANIAVSSAGDDALASSATREAENFLTLASLPVGARLVLRCRKDWRDATVAAVALDCIILCVGSPSGRTYRVRRPPDSALSLDGAIPVLGEGSWRVALARYDTRW